MPKANTVIFGYNNKLLKIIEEMENYVEKDSDLIIVANITEEQTQNILSTFRRNGKNSKQNIDIKHINKNIVDSEILDTLEQEKFDNIILLNSMESYIDEYESQNKVNEITVMEEMDAHTIKSLLNIREYFEKDKNKKGDGFSIVTEMKFSHNKEIVPKGDSDEFIISDEILSAIFAQTVLNKDRGRVYLKTLFLSDGNEIYLKDAMHYVELNEFANFTDILRSASKMKEIAIGYIKDGHIKINPSKSKAVKFNKVDKIIVLAEDFTFNNCK